MKLKIWTIALLSIVLFNMSFANSIADMKKACNDGSGEQCLKVGEKIATEQNSKNSLAESLIYLEKSCELKYGEGCAAIGDLYFMIGNMLPEGKKEKNVTFQKAREAYKRGAEFEDGQCLTAYATFLSNGLGGNVDKTASMKYLTLACQKDYGDACSNLASVFISGEGMTQNYRKAINYAKKACDLKSAQGCSIAASMSDDGQGVTADPVESVRFWEKACDLGDALGCLYTGFSYNEGKFGNKKDEKKAQELFDKSCKYAKQDRNEKLIKYSCMYSDKK